MFIKKIIFENNSILGNIEFDFCNKDGKPYETIILAGENGTGKSTLLNAIYGFFNDFLPSRNTDEQVIFIFELSVIELSIFSRNEYFKSRTMDYELNNEFTVKVDHSKSGNWGAITPSISRKGGPPITFESHFLNDSNVRSVFKSIFSEVEVNYTGENVTSTTSLDIDVPQTVAKSSVSLAKEITQLLVDIDSLDNSDLAEWASAHPDLKVSERPSDTRIKRFKNAFESIFPNKKYKKVMNAANQKQVIFEEFGKTMSINDLSSGEKQIVFRGSFLLRNKRYTEGAIVLIDEPEISLHPNWQLKILDFYKTLFKGEEGCQTSQLFFATHSPFVIHNDTRTNDKVLILKKDDTGQIIIPQQGDFYSWSREEEIKEAFDIIPLQKQIQQTLKHLVITEGKTDWKHLKRALRELRETIEIDENFELLEYEDEFDMGSSHLISLCQSLSKINNDKKMIAIFDRDEKGVIKQASNGGDFKRWGNNVYSFILPVPPHRIATPDICIEHYYQDEEIKLEDNDSRRLYLGNEFSSKTGTNKDYDKVCVYKNKCGINSIQVIDDGVTFIKNEDVNIALSKNKFAQNILDEIVPFKEVSFQSFLPIFNIIGEIIKDTEK